MEYHVNFKEKFYFNLMTVLSFLMYGGLLSAMFINSQFIPMILGYAGLILFIRFLALTFFVGHIKGNAIKVNKNQFPEIFELLKNHSQSLELKTIPDMYILQGNGILNAFALRAKRRNFVVVHSNVLEAAYQEGRDAVSFIIGHELGHIKRNHVGLIKTLLTFPASMIPFLGNAYSRAREYTCDNIGYHLSPAGATKGMLILGAGTQLYKKVNVQQLLATFEHDTSFSVDFVEIFSTHPMLIKRVRVLHSLSRNDMVADSEIFVSPHVDVETDQVRQ